MTKVMEVGVPSIGTAPLSIVEQAFLAGDFGAISLANCVREQEPNVIDFNEARARLASRG
jgi:hypothetical protein